jgi:hypothetical protein
MLVAISAMFTASAIYWGLATWAYMRIIFDPNPQSLAPIHFSDWIVCVITFCIAFNVCHIFLALCLTEATDTPDRLS